MLRYRMAQEPTLPLKNLLSFDEPGLAQFVRQLNWPPYRTGQILRWLYRRRARTIDEMTDLSINDRERLSQVATVERSKDCAQLRSSDGTRKLLIRLDDGLQIETVLIPDDHRLTLCISTQVGCMLDCDFCLTGTMGLKRNLRSYEIVDQVLTAHEQLVEGESVTNLVFMGMGEPLANIEALSVAVRCLTNKSWGLGWSPRRITVSTAGLASRLKEVAALGVNLAISLNGTTEEQRRRLMPAANEIASLKTLLAACRRYPLPPGRRLTFEYVLLAGVNDQPADAVRLTKLTQGLQCKINLIPFNEFPGSPYSRPSDAAILRFQERVKACGLDTFIRKSRGHDVLGACGQLGTSAAAAGGRALTQIESRC